MRAGAQALGIDAVLASNIAQGGATLAVALKAKDENLKSLASSSGFTAVMGITEPCLYGVLLKKLKRPFVASMIGGAAGGIYAGITGLVRYAFVSGINCYSSLHCRRKKGLATVFKHFNTAMLDYDAWVATYIEINAHVWQAIEKGVLLHRKSFADTAVRKALGCTLRN